MTVVQLNEDDVRDRVELAFSRMFRALRALSVVLAVASLVSEDQHMTSRLLAGILVAVSVGEGSWFAVLCWHRRRIPGPVWVTVDVVAQAGLLCASKAAGTPTDQYRIRGWFQPMAFETLAATATTESGVLVKIAVLGLSGSLLFAAYESSTSFAWLIQNPGGFLGVAAVSWSVVRFVRGIAAQADAAREASIKRASEAERVITRDLVHNPAGILEG